MRLVIVAFNLKDALAGHDHLDSTTVTTPYKPITLPDVPSVKGIVIGIPKVSTGLTPYLSVASAKHILG